MKKQPIQLNLGCGIHLYKNFINVDNFFTLKDLQSKKGLFQNALIEPGSKFVQADMAKLPFKTKSVDYIECLNAIEHVEFRSVHLAIKEMWRVLKPKGVLKMMTNDFSNLAEWWMEHIKGKPFDPDKYLELTQLIYGNQMGPGEFHKTPFNPEYLGNMLMWAGFKHKNVKILVIPRGASAVVNMPKLKTQVCEDDGKFVRSDLLFVEAIK